MKRLFALLSVLLLTVTAGQAQWSSKNYPLVQGWNSLWLPGDATHVTVADLFSAYPAVTEVWRWNPNPDQIQFTQNPSSPTISANEWTVWKRDGSETKLTRMVGNSAYLIRTTAAVTVPITVMAMPPTATWLISGSNLLGFPAAAGKTFASYFSTMIAGGVTGLPSTTKVFKYVGGDLVAGTNPVQVNIASEVVNSNTAYWISYPVVSNFVGPIHYELPSSSGLAFGRTSTTQTLGLTNRAKSAVTLTLSVENSATAPAGQPSVLAAVPLLQRTFNSSTNSYTETAFNAGSSISVTVPAQGRVSLDFGVNRSGMTSNGVYAALLRIVDGEGFIDTRLPVSAQATSAAGLWAVEAKVTKVARNTDTTNTATDAAQSFTVPFLLHVDSSGASRVLRQAFVGKLTTAGNAMGITCAESNIQSAAVSDVKPLRYFCPNLPYGTPVVSATGTAGNAGSALSWTLTHLYNDPANPFVHTYHPDHDNLDAKFNATPILAAGLESYTITRNCTLTFTSTSPDGSSVAGWGSVILGGVYTETIAGLNKNAISLSGTFKMRRLSEIGDINTTLP